MENDDDDLARKRARHKLTISLLGIALIVAGLVVLFALKRLPLPLRVMAGLGDVFVGCILLVLVRQIFSSPESKT